MKKPSEGFQGDLEGKLNLKIKTRKARISVSGS
jgi:hypothetical protein